MAALNGEFAAMVTAPVQKSTLMEAGFAFTRPHRISRGANARGAAGHAAAATADCGWRWSRRILPLADVPQAITRERLRATLRIVHMDLERHFSLRRAANRGAGTQSARRRVRPSWAARRST